MNPIRKILIIIVIIRPPKFKLTRNSSKSINNSNKIQLKMNPRCLDTKLD